MITVEQYLGQHLAGHESELTDDIRAAAFETVTRANLLLALAAQDGVNPTVDAQTGCFVGSGWRPSGVNAATANAAKGSRHQTGQALDIRDDRAGRALCRWAVSPAGRLALGSVGLWCERPQWTPSWLHVQTVPPASGNRFLIPSSAAPLCALLPGERP